MKIIAQTFHSTVYDCGSHVEKVFCGELPEVNAIAEFIACSTINAIISRTAFNPNLVHYTPVIRNVGPVLKCKKYKYTIDTYPSPTLADIQRFSLQIGFAIAWLHKHGILHRDIKPENIFVDERGDFYLGDFGSVKCCASVTEDRTTLPYRAPELFDNPIGYTTETDVWAFGMVIFFMQHRLILSHRVLQDIRSSTDFIIYAEQVFGSYVKNKYIALNPNDRATPADRFAVTLQDVKPAKFHTYESFIAQLSPHNTNIKAIEFVATLYFASLSDIQQAYMALGDLSKLNLTLMFPYLSMLDTN